MDVPDDFLQQYTEYNNLDNYTYCNVLIDGRKCNRKIHGTNKFNVKRHMRLVHPYLLLPQKSSEDEKKYNLKVTTTVRNLVQACIEQVTIDGRPLSALHDKGFSRLFDMVGRVSYFFEAFQLICTFHDFVFLIFSSKDRLNQVA